jgi:hypothetical protein
MYGGIVKGVYMIPDGNPGGSWLRLEDEFDYKIDQYPLDELLRQEKEEDA